MAPENRSHNDGGREKKKGKEGEEVFIGTAQHPGLIETRNRLKQLEVKILFDVICQEE